MTTSNAKPEAPTRKRSLLRYLLYLGVVLLLVVLGLLSTIVIWFLRDAGIPYQVSTDGLTMPAFQEVELEFEHRYVGAHSLPAAAGAVIELDNQPPEELFLGGGHGQPDQILRYTDGAFQEISSEVDYTKEVDDATLSSLSLDIDLDGDNDLLISRSGGIWLYTNDNGKLTGKLLDAPMNDDTTPLSIAVADLNNDGHFDMYVSGYLKKELIEGYNIFNQEGYGGTSALLINNGDNSFTNKTEESGLLYKHNTFQGVFADVDNDGDADLVVAHDTGQVRTWRNKGDGTFENVANPNSDVYSYPMGIGMTDYDNDGRVDFFFSNTGTTAPAFMARGDLRSDQVYHSKWILFHNEGDFRFTDTAEATKLADYEFSWGACFDDFNLDGLPDLVVAENYVDMPPHQLEFLRLPGRFFLQNADGEFAAVGEEIGVVNARFGISPLTADFNLDGTPDLVFVNINGKSKAFLSKDPKNHFVKVVLPNTVQSVGAMVKATLADGRTLYRPFVKAEGLCSDSTPVITIGTAGAEVVSVEAKLMSGETLTGEVTGLGTSVILRPGQAEAEASEE